ncbi:hypothetical protein MKW92_030670 [Papaver armeniacum]|nr:hypothetical protein MKW92_030670 [Papaver armeniacum]
MQSPASFISLRNFRITLSSYYYYCSSAVRQMARSSLDEMADTGAFKRTPSTFRSFVSRDPSSTFPAESGRYHLYISYACPWASRCLAYLKIKGLEKAISFSGGRTKETDNHMGWVFPTSSTEEPGAEPDHLNGAKSARELYELASANYTGKYIVPVRLCSDLCIHDVSLKSFYVIVNNSHY